MALGIAKAGWKRLNTEKAMLLRNHDNAEVQRWGLQYTAAVLAYLENENVGPVIREMRNVFRHQLLPFLSHGGGISVDITLYRNSA